MTKRKHLPAEVDSTKLPLYVDEAFEKAGLKTNAERFPSTHYEALEVAKLLLAKDREIFRYQQKLAALQIFCRFWLAYTYEVYAEAPGHEGKSEPEKKEAFLRALSNHPMKEGGHHMKLATFEKCQAVYRCDKWKQDPRRFLDWLQTERAMTSDDEDSDIKKPSGEGPTWNHVVNIARKHTATQGPDKTMEEKKEKAKAMIDRKAESLKRRAKNLEIDSMQLQKEIEEVEKIEIGDRPITAEMPELAEALDYARDIAGMSSTISEDAKGIGSTAKDAAGSVKKVRIVVPEYLEHVRTYNCVRCTAPRSDSEPEGEIVASYFRESAIEGKKDHDIFAIPLCEGCKEFLDNGRPGRGKGWKGFRIRHGSHAWRTIALMYAEWSTGIEIAHVDKERGFSWQ